MKHIFAAFRDKSYILNIARATEFLLERRRWSDGDTVMEGSLHRELSDLLVVASPFSAPQTNGEA